jgi:hypothetical protein
MLLRNMYKTQDTHMIYAHFNMQYFSIIMKVLLNNYSFHSRSVLRNIVFDLMRGFLPTIVMILAYSGINMNWALMLNPIVFTIVWSAFCTTFVKKSHYKRFNVFFSCAMMEFCVTFANSIVMCFNRVLVQH